jgi:hypothetical protein
MKEIEDKIKKDKVVYVPRSYKKTLRKSNKILREKLSEEFWSCIKEVLKTANVANIGFLDYI